MTAGAVDIAIVGAGPAGLSAAAAAAEHGLTAALIDEQPAPGGQIWRNLEARGGDRRGLDLIRRVRSGGVDLRVGAALFHAELTEDGATLSWIDGAGVGRTTARALVLATGAMERPVPFPGWTLPGVLGVGALQTALKSGGLVPDDANGGLVVAGSGPLALLYAAQLTAAGGRISAILEFDRPVLRRDAVGPFLGAAAADPRTVGRGILLLARRVLSGVPVHRSVRNIAAIGGDRIEAVRFESAAGTRSLPCSVLAVHDGVIPNTQVTRLLRLDHEWRDGSECFAPVTDRFGRASRAGVWVAGDGAGIEGGEAAEAAGRLAALDIARALGRITETTFDKQAAGPLRRRRAARELRRLLDTLDPPLDPSEQLDDDTIVCRCEEITAGAVRAAIASGAAGPNRVKTATRCGMGACQGRMCGPILTRLIARETGRAEADVGALRIRPPLKPVPLGALAAMGGQQ